MGRKRTRRLPYCREYLRQAWLRQGQWQAVMQFRQTCRARGYRAETAYRKALEQFPITTETVKHLRTVRSEKLANWREERRTAAEARQRAEEEMRLRMKAARSDVVAECTGIPLLDWVFANMGEALPIPEPAAGDLAFLQWCQGQPAKFYRDIYLPAMLKHNSVGPQGGAQSSQPEVAERTTDELLAMIRSAAGQPGSPMETAVLSN